MSEEIPAMFDADIGRTMRWIRHQRGLSLTETGAMIGVTYQQIQKYEKGMNRISASMLYRFAQTMRCPMSIFYENVGNMPEIKPIIVARSRNDVVDAQALARITNEDVRRSICALVTTIAEQQIDRAASHAEVSEAMLKRHPRRRYSQPLVKRLDRNSVND